MTAVQGWVARLPDQDRDAILGGTSARIYGITGRSVPAADTPGRVA
jgi:hypothetical protein